MAKFFAKWAGKPSVVSGMSYTNLAKQAPLIQRGVMHTTAQEIYVPAIKQQIRENKSVFRGGLFQKVKIQQLEGAIPSIDVGVMGVPYAEEVEKGGPPRKVSEAEKRQIRDYVAKKNGVSGSDVERVAMAIIKTIETVGTKPHPYIKPATDRVTPAFYLKNDKRMAAQLKLAYHKGL